MLTHTKLSLRVLPPQHLWTIGAHQGDDHSSTENSTNIELAQKNSTIYIINKKGICGYQRYKRLKKKDNSFVYMYISLLWAHSRAQLPSSEDLLYPHETHGINALHRLRLSHQ